MVSEDEVRQHVTTAVRKADLNTVSAKQIRRTVEKQLHLEQDDLASGKWKKIVKTVIEETMAAIERGDPSPQEDDESEEKIARTFPMVLLIVSEERTAEESCDRGYADFVACEIESQVSISEVA
jgi:DEK C terminal domain